MPHSYRFGDFEVLPVERQILVGGQPAAVGARAFDVLLTLIAHRDRVVTKHELLDAAWPGLCVEENNLHAQISALRKILGPRTFATIPGLGYRFSMALGGHGEEVVERLAANSASPLTNVPAATESLIGRDVDIAAVKRLVGQQRLVTIVGAGGIGKTRLAQQAARELTGTFEHGVWWVDLATVSKNLIAPAIAKAADLKLGAGDAIAQLVQSLGGRHMLLVLDNCEYLAADVAAMARIALGAAPATRILVTSQELLKIPGEHAYPLDALTVPSHGVSLEVSRSFSAVALLERRTRAIDPRFSITDANLGHAIELCTHLDGIPLAIEMAAARVSVLGLEALVARLGERLRLLRSADRGAPARYQTMRATLEWSHSLLSDEQQTVLRRLSAFVGSFRLDMAQLVCASGDLDEWKVLDCLGALVEKSLVKVEHVDPPRYRLLETTRLFGLELLAERGEGAATILRHGRAMAVLNEEVMRAFDEQPESVCTQRYVADYDDLLAAFDRAHERGDIEVCAANIMALSRYDLARGFYFAMPHRKKAAYSMVPAAGPVARARLWYCVVMGRAIPCAGVSKITAAREEVAAWRRIGDRNRLYDALVRQASNLGTAGDFAAAERALSDARALDDPSLPAQIRAHYSFNATVVAAYGGNLPLFKERIEQQEAMAAETSFKRLAAVCKVQRAEWALSSGSLKMALESSVVAIAGMRAIENPFGLANSLCTYCDGLLMAGRLETIPALLREAVPMAIRNGIGGWAFDPLALFGVRTGYAEAAAKMLGFADARYAAIEEVRRPFDKRIESLAMTETAAVLGARALARLRRLGAEMSEEQAQALADEVLPPQARNDSVARDKMRISSE